MCGYMAVNDPVSVYHANVYVLIIGDGKPYKWHYSNEKIKNTHRNSIEHNMEYSLCYTNWNYSKYVHTANVDKWITWGC